MTLTIFVSVFVNFVQRHHLTFWTAGWLCGWFSTNFLIFMLIRKLSWLPIVILFILQKLGILDQGQQIKDCKTFNFTYNNGKYYILSRRAPTFLLCMLYKVIISRGRCGRDRMIVGFITTCAISAYHQLKLCVRTPFTARCTRYNIYVIKFVSDLWQVGGFLRYSGFRHQ